MNLVTATLTVFGVAFAAVGMALTFVGIIVACIAIADLVIDSWQNRKNT